MFRYCYLIALGSNLGELSSNLDSGIQALSSLGSFCFFSKRHSVAAVLPPGELNRVAPDYLNQVGLLLCSLKPEELYSRIKNIEDLLGHPRNTEQVWPDRHLDMDLLLMWERVSNLGGVVVADILNEQGWILKEHVSENVLIPHREFKNRPFLEEMFLEASS